MNIRLVETRETLAGTENRALELLGFDIANLDALWKRLVASGVSVIGYHPVDQQFSPMKAMARIRDPWGTVIELDEGFRAAVK
jgi:hypothetical protein